MIPPLGSRLIQGSTYYYAGTDGFIYSVNTTKGNAPRRLKGALDRHGYRFVNFRIDGVMKCRKVHALICEAFHGGRTIDKPVTRHLDGNRLNNVPENLCWGTAKENSEDMVRHGTSLHGERSPMAKLTKDDAREILQRRLFGESGTSIAREFGVTPRIVYLIERRELWREVTS